MKKKSPYSLSSSIITLNVIKSRAGFAFATSTRGGLGALKQPIPEGKTFAPTDTWPDPDNPLQFSSTSFYNLRWLQHPSKELVHLSKLRNLDKQ